MPKKSAEGDGAAAPGDDAAALITVNQHGSRLLQALLSFKGQEIVPITTSVLTLPTAGLVKLATDGAGSRLYEAMLKADIGPKKRGKLVAKLKGHFAQLSATKFGSRVVDKCWAASEIKRKEIIATELLKEEAMLKDNYFGRLVLRNCKIDYFKRKQDGWAESLNANDRKRKLFQEFLDPDTAAEAPSTAKKSKKSAEKRAVSSGMEALGFGASGAADDAAEVDQALAMADDGPDSYTPQADIDGIFKSKRRQDDGGSKKSKKSKKDKTDTGDDASAKSKKRNKKEEKKRAKAAAGLEDIFAAVAATKKKGSKKKKKAEGDQEGDKTDAKVDKKKKKKKKEKKQFTMS
mmetsp:Transcript_21219/g.63204  ORF Transcript_21219/g.63204 Transcript_21219/m.63204 type:complete len:348 (+) Transcript_21219:1363-2406(+)